MGRDGSFDSTELLQPRSIIVVAAAAKMGAGNLIKVDEGKGENFRRSSEIIYFLNFFKDTSVPLKIFSSV